MAPGAIEVLSPLSGLRLDLDEKHTAVATVDVISPAEIALEDAIDRFTARNPASQALHRLATSSMPGGNTRTQLHTSPFPVCMRSGSGYQVTSEDSHVYTDMVGELTAAVYGHSHPVILASVMETLTTVGLNLGATIAQEHVFARELCERFHIDRVRFTNCGTEANLHALAGARAFTGKRKVVVFAGGYHGGVLSFGGGVAAANNVDRDDFIVARYNDIDSARAAIAREGVAAVLVEGMQGASGAIPGSRKFLKAVEESAKQAGVVFILDEVMTSRVAPGGLASLHDLQPDMKSFGKYLGGGLAFGAFGGRADILAVFDPRPSNPSPLAHHGTFNNNTLAMHVGHAGLTGIYTPDVCTEFNTQGSALLSRLREVSRGTKLCFTGVGTILASHFTDEGIEAWEREAKENWTLKDLFWLEMMEAGFWMTRRGSISLVLGTPTAELERFTECVAAFIARHDDLVRVA